MTRGHRRSLGPTERHLRSQPTRQKRPRRRREVQYQHWAKWRTDSWPDGTPEGRRARGLAALTRAFVTIFSDLNHNARRRPKHVNDRISDAHIERAAHVQKH